MASDAEIVNIINTYRIKSDEGRTRRMALNAANRDAFNCEQDFSKKVEGQSTEFIPKTATTVEQFSAFLKRGLTKFGNWFSVDMPRVSQISGYTIVDILMWYLDNLPDDGVGGSSGIVSRTSFSTRLSDNSKLGLLESAMIFKVHGFNIEKPVFNGKKLEKIRDWRLAVDIVASEDYYPDPLGHGLFEIQRSRTDLHRVQALAEEGIYDKSAVDELIAGRGSTEDEDAERRQHENEMDDQSYRNIVIVDECWGTLVDGQGNVLHENVLAAVGNERILIRKPQPMPYWHGESPFVVIPIIRKPLAVWHKALYDDATPLNNALNELFNLMLDGGIASVWGVRQVRPDLLEDPDSISDGVPQNKTLALRDDAPLNAKAMETVTTGEIPQAGLTLYQLLEKEFNQSVLTNDLKLGTLPSGEVTATEVVEASQSQAVVLDAVVAEMEQKIETLLRKCWFTIIQNGDDFTFLDPGNAEGVALSRMEPEQRFNLFTNGNFKVNGLSNTLARTQDLNKLMAIVNLAFQNPVIAQALMQRVSGNRLWETILKLANVDPKSLEMSEEERATQLSVGQTAQLAEAQGAGSQGGGQSNPVEAQVPAGERLLGAAPLSPSPVT